jgi:hypothetical protein
MSFHLSPDDLFALVKSLTPAEKRYFRLQAGIYSGDKAYMKLFDLLDQQNVFDEATLKQEPGGSSASNFSVIKKYLFNKIIKSLKNYGAYRDSDSDLGDLIETYKILEYKGLVRISGCVLQHAKKKAYEEEAFLRLCYILVVELIRLAHFSSDPSKDLLQTLIEERRRALGIIQNYSIIGDHLYQQRQMIRQVDKVRDTALERALLENIEPLLRMEKNQLLSKTAVSMYNIAMRDYFSALGDAERALHYLSDSIST